MPYTINKSNGTVLVVLTDGTINNTNSSLTLVGKNYSNYGEAFNENLVRITENFANAGAPNSPMIGQLWYDTSVKSLKVFQGGAESWRAFPTTQTMAGTANQITVTPGLGNLITFSLPQNIHTLATPTFDSLTLTKTTGAPFTISSNSLISNLNADLLDGQHGTYYLNYNNLTNKPTFGSLASLSTITLGTNTVGNYMVNVSSGNNGIVVSHTQSPGSVASISHADTSAIANIINSTNSSTTKFIKDISFSYDDYGHVTATSITSAAESSGLDRIRIFQALGSTVQNVGSGYTWNSNNSATLNFTSPGSLLEFHAGYALEVKIEDTKKAIVINHADTSTAASTVNINGNVVRNISVDDFGHLTAITSANMDDRYYTKNLTDAAYLAKSGGILTGALTLAGAPTSANHAATKEYVDRTVFTNGTGFADVGFTNIVGQWSNDYNYFDVFPPSGKTMANLVAFIASIHVIHFTGVVDWNDSLRCTWTYYSDRIRVYVQNTEQRSNPGATWLAIWR